MAAVYKIPLRPNLAAQRVRVTLDGRRYRLDLDWIQRLRRWSFSLFTDSGDPIVRCKGLVLGADLLKRTRYRADCPQGALLLVDRRDMNEDASLDSLGVRHDLIYYPRP